MSFVAGIGNVIKRFFFQLGIIIFDASRRPEFGKPVATSRSEFGIFGRPESVHSIFSKDAVAVVPPDYVKGQHG